MSSDGPSVPGLVITGDLGRQSMSVGRPVPVSFVLLFVVATLAAALLISAVTPNSVFVDLMGMAALGWGLFGLLSRLFQPPPIQATLTATHLTLQGHRYPLDQIEQVSFERLEAFTHLYITVAGERQHVASHGSRDAVRALALRLQQEVARPGHDLGTHRDVPDALRALLKER